MNRETFTPILPVVPGFELPVTTYAKDQPEYLQLPSWKSEEGLVVTRWHIPFWSRLKIAFGGSIWLSIKTFNNPLQPVRLTAHCPIMGSPMLDKET